MEPGHIQTLALLEQEALNLALKTDEGKLAEKTWTILATEIAPKTDKQTIFYGYHTQVNSMASLALISIMRRHASQGLSMLRNCS